MENIPNLVETEKKKRGRKKKVLTEEELQIQQQETVKKKRGRKKKWETETTTKILNHSPIIFSENVLDDQNTPKPHTDENYEQEHVSFGNLNIKVHTVKDNINYDSIRDSLQKNQNKCRINLTTSDLEDQTSEEDINDDLDEEYDKNINIIKKNRKKIPIKRNLETNKSIKCLKFFSDQFSNGEEIKYSNFRCHHCHHKFNNQPFFLPYEFCSNTSRYKVCGNFCSPNCVKTYAINSKIHCTKVNLVGEMYRKLYGKTFCIKPAPPIQILKEYGGNLTISEYRENFNNKINYKLIPICSKIIYQEIIQSK